MKPQEYISSKLLSNYEVEVLSKMRSRNLDLKSNFKTKFTFNNIIDLECSLNGCSEVEDQQHLMNCKPILENLNANMKISDFCYNDLFSNKKKQNKITKLYVTLLDIRSNLLQQQQQQ